VHHEFRRAYETAKGPDTHFVVDLSRAEYIDSSGLGMLLMLREHAGGDRSDVRIANATGEVRDILAISNFDRLFRVD
jgi:anti-anti-sigma factor